MEHFSTGRLTARDWTEDDADDAFAIYGRDEVMRWLGPLPRHPVESVGQMRESLTRRIARAREQPGYGLWPLQLRTAGAVVGAVLLSPLPASEDVEIGWHLNPDHWGAGYATEAGRGVIALAFGLTRIGQDMVGPDLADRLPGPVLDEVLAVVDPDNVRSQNVCRRLGMRHCGRTDQYYGLTLELFRLARSEVG
jgi:RimJ/RimL family protein N-acetyltransferase